MALTEDSINNYLVRRSSRLSSHLRQRENNRDLSLPWYVNGTEDGVDENNTYLQSKQTRAKSRAASKKMKRSRGSPAKTVIVYRNADKEMNLTTLFSQSSVPGMREISLSNSLLRKIFWFLAFIILGLICLTDIHLLLSDFYSYPVTVDVRLSESRKLAFPAVTVCNLNIVRYSALCNGTLNVSIPYEMKEKLCGFPAKSDHNDTDFFDINDINQRNDYNTDTETLPLTTSAPRSPRKRNSGRPKRPKRQAQSKSGKGRTSGGAKGGKGSAATQFNRQQEEAELTERQEKELQENLTTWLAVLSSADKLLTYNLGHQFEDMVLRCTMKSANCTSTLNFEASFSSTEGNCYTYKSVRRDEEMNEKLEEISLAGIEHGLEMVLNLEVSEYLPGTAEIGALVMIHPPGVGTTASEAIYVSPEKTTFIGLKMVSITRLPDPYPEHCVDFWPESLKHVLSQNATYSQQVCLKMCLQRTMLKICGCQSAKLPAVELDNKTPRICDTRRGDTRNCVEKVMLVSGEKFNDCECPPRCQVTQYEKTISLAKWPSREDRVSFDKGQTNINLQNVAKVVIYYNTMTLQQVNQQGAWTTGKLFSSLGGFMGMYVGFSFFSLVEVFEILFRRFVYGLKKHRPTFKTVAKVIAKTTRTRISAK